MWNWNREREREREGKGCCFKVIDAPRVSRRSHGDRSRTANAWTRMKEEKEGKIWKTQAQMPCCRVLVRHQSRWKRVRRQGACAVASKKEPLLLVPDCPARRNSLVVPPRSSPVRLYSSVVGTEREFSVTWSLPQERTWRFSLSEFLVLSTTIISSAVDTCWDETRRALRMHSSPKLNNFHPKSTRAKIGRYWSNRSHTSRPPPSPHWRWLCIKICAGQADRLQCFGRHRVLHY